VSALLLVLFASATWEQPIEVSQPGRLAVVIDRHVYAKARPDLADLRVVDESGRLVAYLLERTSTVAISPLQPAPLNREFEKGRSESVTLDFGGVVKKHALQLRLSGDNFRRHVSVEGSDDGRSWSTLTEDAYVFAVPGVPAARFETVRFPENDRRYLRVRVEYDEPGTRRIEILSVLGLAGPQRVASTSLLRPRLTRIEDPGRHETQVVLDLAVRAQPFEEFRLEIDAASFFRAVSVEGRRDPAPAAAGQLPEPLRWAALGEAAVYRYTEHGRVREQLGIVLQGRERAVRLRLHNRDDQPLAISSVSVLVPIERVLFEAHSGRSYRLQYGAPNATAPSFDLARTAGDPASWGASASVVGLGAARPIAPGQDTRPWTERHPRLLWIGLVAVVAALGSITWRALRVS
jgi:hypothetical protein